MKNKLILLAIIPLATLLGSCGDTEWSWWEDDNVTIEKFISLKDAQKALDMSSMNFNLATNKSYKMVYNTYYKNYLGKFSTETDSNITSSVNSTSSRYKNDIVVTNSTSNNEQSYLNAKSVANIKKDTYLIPQSNKNITQREILDYGYGEKVGTDTNIPYIDDETYKFALSIGSTLSSTQINWDKATYGFAKNDDIIIETMSSSTGTYVVKFNNKSLTTFVTNNYCLYRLKSFTKDDKTTDYVLDYSYSKVEVLIGSNIFDEPLSEPYLLEKKESATSYNTKANKEFDTSKIPVIK